MWSAEPMTSHSRQPGGQCQTTMTTPSLSSMKSCANPRTPTRTIGPTFSPSTEPSGISSSCRPGPIRSCPQGQLFDLKWRSKRMEQSQSRKLAKGRIRIAGGCPRTPLGGCESLTLARDAHIVRIADSMLSGMESPDQDGLRERPLSDLPAPAAAGGHRHPVRTGRRLARLAAAPRRLITSGAPAW